MGKASSVYDRLSIYVYPTGEARIGGVEMGKLTVLHVSRRPQDGEGRVRLIVKEAGHLYWTGVGQPRSYAPVEYHVLEVREHGGGSGIGGAADGYTIIREVEVLTPAEFRSRKADLIPTTPTATREG